MVKMCQYALKFSKFTLVKKFIHFFFFQFIFYSILCELKIEFHYFGVDDELASRSPSNALEHCKVFEMTVNIATFN